MSRSAVELMDRGMRCLAESLGDIDTEEFIYLIQRENFDYTKWRKDNLFVGMSVDDINNYAIQYEKAHPFKGKCVTSD